MQYNTQVGKCIDPSFFNSVSYYYFQSVIFLGSLTSPTLIGEMKSQKMFSA
jgi:hypothetical protein